jgi:DNA polymerase-1
VTATLDIRRPPVVPAVEGTRWSPELRAHYTVGREHVAFAIKDILRRSDRVAVDIETEGLGVLATRLKTVTIGDEQAAVVFDPRDPTQHDLIRRVLDIPRWLVFHNSPYDVPNMARNGLFTPELCAKVQDTLIYARLAEPDELVQKSLEACWGRWGDSEITEASMREVFKLMKVTKAEGYQRIDLDRQAFITGCVADVVLTARLLARARLAAYRRVTEGHPYGSAGVQGDEAWRLVSREQRLNQLMLRRTCRGLRVDLEFLAEYRRVNESAIWQAESELEAAGIRPTVAGDLVKVLEADGAFPPGYKRTAKTQNPSTEKKHLEKLDHPLAKTWLHRKEMVKVQDDYLQKVVDLADHDYRIHPTVDFLKATTGRMAMGTPPLQQFPGPARGIVLADEGGSMTSIDWSQIEPVLAANLAGEETFLARYEDLTVKADIYTPIGEAAGISRKHAKVVLLATLYGQGKATLAAGLGTSVDEAVALQAKVRAAMPKVSDLDRQLRYLAREHELIFTLSGRILPIGRSRWLDGEETVAAHKGVNYAIQGGAYDILAESMISIEDAGLGDAIYLAVHDELVVETEAAPDIRKIMQQPPARLCELAERTPILRTDSLDLGERWAEA